MSAFVAPTLPPVDAVFWRCECGAPIWAHGRHNQDGNQIWDGCAGTGCDKYRASDGTAWPTTYGGATLDEPTDLDRDTDHWVDGNVRLAGDEAAL